MKALNAYIKQKNEWNAIFKSAPHEISTRQGRLRLAESIDRELSPENLYCDGEISQSAAMAKRRKLQAAATDLYNLDPVVLEVMYEYQP